MTDSDSQFDQSRRFEHVAEEESQWVPSSVFPVRPVWMIEPIEPPSGWRDLLRAHRAEISIFEDSRDEAAIPVLKSSEPLNEEMSEEEFKRRSARLKKELLSLRGAAVRRPSEDKVFDLMHIARIACDFLATPLRGNQLAEYGEAGGAYNETMKRVATGMTSWPVVVSTLKGEGLTFERPAAKSRASEIKESPSQLDLFLEEIGLGTKHPAIRMNKFDQRKGTHPKSLPGFVASEIQQIRVLRDQFSNLPTGEISLDDATAFIPSAIALAPLSIETAKQWAEVIVQKGICESGRPLPLSDAEAEVSLEHNDDEPSRPVERLLDLHGPPGFSDLVDLIGKSAATWSRQAGGGKIESYAVNRVKMAIMDLLQRAEDQA